MDLTATLGFNSVASMLDELDSNEYSFWFAKYRKACFGPSVNNNMLAQVAFYIYAAFGGGKSGKPNDFLIKIREVEDPAIIMMKSTVARYGQGIRLWLKRKDLTREDLEKQKIEEDFIKKILSGEITKEELNIIAKDITDRYRQGLESKMRET